MVSSGRAVRVRFLGAIQDTNYPIKRHGRNMYPHSQNKTQGVRKGIPDSRETKGLEYEYHNRPAFCPVNESSSLSHSFHDKIVFPRKGKPLECTRRVRLQKRLPTAEAAAGHVAQRPRQASQPSAQGNVGRGVHERSASYSHCGDKPASCRVERGSERARSQGR
jgi:hypothetical protein